MKIADVMISHVKSCTAETNLAAVTQLLRHQRRAEGIISLDDLAVTASNVHTGSPTPEQIVDTLNHLCAPLHDHPRRVVLA